jgi:lipopolysaccharide assembly outer membrane protein LptD (OstA)
MFRLQKICFLIAVLVWGASPLWSQPMSGGMGPVAFGGFGDQPVEITADGETRFEGGVAVAEDNVQVHYGDVSIYADYAEYNPDTRDVFLDGNVRIYTPEGAFVGQRAVYNLETKQTRALEFAGEFFPLRFRATSLRAPSMR